MNRQWTQFAVDAEVEHFGTARLCAAHNKLRAEVAALRKIAEAAARSVNNPAWVGMEKCMWCDKPATRYCDAVIGMEPRGALRDSKGNVTGLLGGLDGAQFTCDAPMCSDHARQVGWVCGAEPDSIDHCPHHTEHGEAPMRDLFMFEGEAEVKRRDVHAEIRRSLMRIERSNVEFSGVPAEHSSNHPAGGTSAGTQG